MSIANTLMKTKYGEITSCQFDRYRSSLIGKIYSILPMKEEKVKTVPEYIESINRELIKTIDVFEHCERVLTVVCLLESLINEENHDVYRKEVLHCCNIISRLGEKNV